AQLEGVRTHPDVASLPLAPDLVVVATAPETVAGLVAEVGTRGSRAVVIISGGFAELGVRGRELQDEVLRAARPNLVRILGPNCAGLLAPQAHLNASLAHVPAAAGRLAFVSQSGAILTSVLDWAKPRGIGFSHLVSLGDMADVDFGDILDYLANEPDTSGILLHIEAIKEARKFLSAARAAARNKPVIVVKTGRHPESARAAALHTGAPEGSDDVYDAAFRRVGLLRVSALEDLFDAVATLDLTKPPASDRLAILTNGGGMGVIATDVLIDEGGRLAELAPEARSRLDELLPPTCPRSNPVDVGGDASPELYSDAFRLLRDAGGTDAVVAIHCPNALTSSESTARALIDASRERPDVPLFVSWVGGASVEASRRLFAEARIPSFETPGQAVRSFLSLVRYRRSQNQLMETPPSISQEAAPDVEAARRTVNRAIAEGRATLSEAEAGALLDAYGVRNVAAERPRSGPDLFVGVKEDSLFGPVIVFGRRAAGPGGTAETRTGLPPLNLRLARELVADDVAGEGDAIAVLLVRIAQLVVDLPEVCALEIDPLVLDGKSANAVSARICVRPDERPGRSRLAIRPYPKKLEETVPLGDGRVLLLRPIRPEDEPALRRSFDKLTDEEKRLRFFTNWKHLSHPMAARFVQLDYDREMALVLTDPVSEGEGEIYGVVRLHADADNQHAEFAVIVGGAMTGLGLGPMLVRRIIDYARGRGIGEVHGDVLARNLTMRKLCKVLGFRESVDVGDASIIKVRLKLNDAPR
ncbi:MAG: GNAT family N-acetyltransferase, partial [Deltaproteobacteria bacterium]|nr:GNAT family N-acetyltransferase [Deltaproteobacteria bacterium]